MKSISGSAFGTLEFLGQKFRFCASKSFYSDKAFMQVRREYTTKLNKAELAGLAILGRFDKPVAKCHAVMSIAYG
jgi:hypothetical protein